MDDLLPELAERRAMLQTALAAYKRQAFDCTMQLRAALPQVLDEREKAAGIAALTRQRENARLNREPERRMTLDSEEQRAMLLECLNAVSVPGNVTEIHVDLKRAVAAAPLAVAAQAPAPDGEKE